MMLNKIIYVNGVEYQLELETYGAPYKAILRKDERFISQIHFLNMNEISKHLRSWVLSAIEKDNRKEIFQAIEQWNGVIE